MDERDEEIWVVRLDLASKFYAYSACFYVSVWDGNVRSLLWLTASDHKHSPALRLLGITASDTVDQRLSVFHIAQKARTSRHSRPVSYQSRSNDDIVIPHRL
jgi:hypothetical protein